jgi:MFS family permease
LFVHVSGDSFESWGWRVPFLLSLVLVAIGLYVRLRILETPIFAKVVQARQVERAPVAEVIKRNPREIILSAFLRVAEQAPFYVFTAYILAFGVSELGFDSGFLLNAVLVAAGLELISIPLFGHISDVIGRKRMYLIGAVALGVFAIPYFAMLDSQVGWLVFLAIVLSLIPHDMMYGPQAALIAESFSTKLRYSGAGLGYQLASVIAGGPAPLAAAFFFSTFGTAYAIAAYLILCSVVTVIATAMLPDRSRVDIADDTAYAVRAQPPMGEPGPAGS